MAPRKKCGVTETIVSIPASTARVTRPIHPRWAVLASAPASASTQARRSASEASSTVGGTCAASRSATGCLRA